MAIDMVRDVDRLRGEMNEIRKDLATLTYAVRDFGTEKSQEALDKLERYGKRARKQMRRTERRIEHQVEERPIVSLVAAFGIGFLFAKLLDAGRH